MHNKMEKVVIPLLISIQNFHPVYSHVYLPDDNKGKTAPDKVIYDVFCDYISKKK
jgi:hypothetical protein